MNLTKYIIIQSILCLFCLTCKADKQDNVLDSLDSRLQKNYETGAKNSENLEILKKLYDLTKISDPYLALEYAGQALQLAVVDENNTLQAEWSEALADIYFEQKVYYLAMEHYFHAYSIYLSSSDNVKSAYALLKYGDTYFIQNVEEPAYYMTASEEGLVGTTDIDFQNPADPTIPAVFAEDTSDEAPAAYYIEGKLGKIYFAGFDEDNNTATGFALGVGEEYPDVLRVGNGDATVYIDEANQPGDDDCLRVTFDMFFGNLSGKNAGIELQNAAGERVAGFSINRYHGSLAYNDFNSVLTNDGDGLNLLKYVSGVGSSSASNAAIAAASNCSSFDLVIDYHNKTLQGTLNNAKNGICEGKAMPFRTDIEDQKVVKFVLRSNYNNKDRRCWFDNLKISKYALADVEEDITEKTWADHTDWVDTGVKSINNAAADKAIYTLSGVRVTKASKPGMYIQNGKKFVIK